MHVVTSLTAHNTKTITKLKICHIVCGLKVRCSSNKTAPIVSSTICDRYPDCEFTSWDILSDVTLSNQGPTSSRKKVRGGRKQVVCRKSVTTKVIVNKKGYISSLQCTVK